MRYYAIEITELTGEPFATYTSYINGASDPNALHVELDIIAAIYATPIGGSSVRIWGVPITVVSQARDFNGKRIRVFAGMKKGLPLANPAQAGLLVEGVVMQAFGNWIGSAMTLDLVIMPSIGTATDPKNIPLFWPAGEPLTEPLRSALQIAFPNQAVTVSINGAIVQDRDEAAVYETLPQFASWLKDKTRALIGGDYPGVDIVTIGDAVRAYDNTAPSAAKQIAFNDLVGQPTCIEPFKVQMTTVMRADISVGDYVRLPPAQITTTPQALSQYRDNSIFQGEFQVQLVRHVGAFRTPDALAWITTIDMASTQALVN